MSHPEASRTVTVRNPLGMHLRPWGEFAELAATFDAKTEVINGSQRVNGTSAMNLLTLVATKGTELVIEAVGRDADAAVAALSEMIENLFEETESTDPQQSG